MPRDRWCRMRLEPLLLLLLVGCEGSRAIDADAGEEAHTLSSSWQKKSHRY